MQITFNDLRRIDFNLGVVFLALWQERSVTLAAHRLSLSQAAVSAALARLRAMCDDPLFVRTRSGMEPTPRARMIAEPLAVQLAALHRTLVAQTPFDSRQSNRKFTLGMSDDMELAVGPYLAETLAHQAPSVNIVFRRVNRYDAEQFFDSREIDLAMVSGPVGRLPLSQEKLGELGYGCLLNAQHMKVKLPISLAEYTRLPHVLVSPLGREGIVDASLRTMGLQRRVQTALTDFASLPAYLLRLGAVATAPLPTCVALAKFANLQVCPPPIDLGKFAVTMLWRRDSASDAGLEWMQAQFRLAFALISRTSVANSRVPRG